MKTSFPHHCGILKRKISVVGAAGFEPASCRIAVMLHTHEKAAAVLRPVYKNIVFSPFVTFLHTLSASGLPFTLQVFAVSSNQAHSPYAILRGVALRQQTDGLCSPPPRGAASDGRISWLAEVIRCRGGIRTHAQVVRLYTTRQTFNQLTNYTNSFSSTLFLGNRMFPPILI